MKESGIVTQELVALKLFVETSSHTEAVETQETTAQTKAEVAETHEMTVHTEAKTVEMKELSVQIEEEEAIDRILYVETK